MEDFYANGGDECRVNKQLYGMILHEMSKIAVLHHRRVLETCGHQEEKDECNGDAAVNGDGPAQVFLIIERKHNARDPHDHKSNHKCNGNGEEDTENDGKCFVRIDQLGIGQTFIEDMFQCQGCRSAK